MADRNSSRPIRGFDGVGDLAQRRMDSRGKEVFAYLGQGDIADGPVLDEAITLA
jgi:hypothetical protein